MLDHFFNVEIAIARAKLLDCFARLEGATAATADVIALEKRPLRAGISLQDLRHGALWGDCGGGNHSGVLKEFLDVAQDFDKRIDFRRRVVKIKAGARGGRHAESLHERLIAMVPAAQGDATLIRDGDDVVGMNSFEQKADEPGPANRGAEEPNTVHGRK